MSYYDRNDHDPLTKRAPSKECLAHATQHLGHYENQTMLRLQLDFLLDQNDEDVSHVHPNRGRALTPGAVYLILLVCNGLELADAIKFSALEIYDRFMLEYNKYLCKQLRGSDSDELRCTNKRLRSQAFLRMMSCIQLASKLNSDITRPYMPASKVRDVLKNFGKDYTLSSVNSSELRVLKTLNYKLQYVNTLEIMECVLLRLKVEEGLDADYYGRIYALSVEALEFMYKQHDYVYRMFWKNSSLNYSPDSQDLYRQREYNKAIESAAILAAVIFMIRHTDEKRLFPKIAEISRVRNSDLMQLATVLVGLLGGPIRPANTEEAKANRRYLRAQRRVNR